MLNLLWFLLGLMAFFSVFLTIVFRLEKRMVWPYGDLGADPPFGDPNGYGARNIQEAAGIGYSFLGWARDQKGPTYRCSYAMLVSPNREIFAVVGVGAILTFQLRAVWLHTPTMDGRSFYSTNHQHGVQIDLSRNWTNQLVPFSSFAHLVNKHQEWIHKQGLCPRPFAPGREYAEFRALREQHFRHMERAGLISYTDASASHFHYTFAASARTAIWSYFLGMARQLSSGRFPRNA